MPLLDKWAIFDHPQVNWQPNPAQLTVAESPCRYKLLAGGRRLGKDFFAGTDKLLPEIILTKALASTLLAEGRKRIFWIVGPSYQEAEKTFRVIWNWCKRLEIPMDKGSFNSPEIGLMQIKCWDGALEIIAKSSQVPERLVGEGLSGVILCEAAKMRSIIWPKYLQPTLGDFGGWAYFGSTPEGKNWFYDLWRHAQDPYNLDWASWRMPSWVNPWVYTETGRDFVKRGLTGKLIVPDHEITKEADVYRCLELMRRTNLSAHKLMKQYEFQIDIEILQRLNDLPPELFMQEIAADFTEFVGRVFKEFDEEVHVTDLSYNPGWDTYAAVDFGFNNPNVWLLLQVGKWGEINVLDEIYESGLDPEDFADEVRYRGLNPANLRYIFTDPADPGATKILEKKLNVRSQGGTGGELNNRLNWIRKFLREPRYVVDEPYHDISLDGITVGQARPRLMFDRKCKHTIQDMLDYRYPEKRDDAETSNKRFDLPMKKFDHGPEALGRFCAGYFGQFGRTGARVHQATFSSKTPEDARKDPRWTKSSEFRRPAAHEQRRTEFPKVNNALGNYLSGAYDE